MERPRLDELDGRELEELHTEAMRQGDVHLAAAVHAEMRRRGWDPRRERG